MQHHIQVVDIEFPVKAFLTCKGLSHFVMFSLWWGKERRKRENKKEKEGEANLIMRDHHQKPMSTCVSPKGPTS